MGRKALGKKILIVGHGDTLSAAIQLQLAKHAQEGFEVITPDQAKERGITITSSIHTISQPEPIELKTDYLKDYTLTPFEPPETRRERRARLRKIKNSRKP